MSPSPPGQRSSSSAAERARITHDLVALGHPVVAVDQSPEMLSYVRGAETVLADIERLRLGRTFRVVLLASQLVNTAEDDRRRRFLTTCRRHVSADGVVIVQRLDPGASWDEAETSVGDVRVRMLDVRRDGSLVSATAQYRTVDQVWRHSFTSRILDDPTLDRALGEAGLERRRWLESLMCGWKRLQQGAGRPSSLLRRVNVGSHSCNGPRGRRGNHRGVRFGLGREPHRSREPQPIASRSNGRDRSSAQAAALSSRRRSRCRPGHSRSNT